MIFIRYTIIQLFAYGIDAGLFLITLQGELLGLVLANTLSKLSAGIFAFVAHRHLTFRISHSPITSQQTVRYFLLLTLNIPISSAMLTILTSWIIQPMIAKMIADIICVILTYGLCKRFIFIEKNKYQSPGSGKGAIL